MPVSYGSCRDVARGHLAAGERHSGLMSNWENRRRAETFCTPTASARLQVAPSAAALIDPLNQDTIFMGRQCRGIS